MTKWQPTVALAITDMHTDNCAMWDGKRITIDEATQTFGEVRRPAASSVSMLVRPAVRPL